MLWSSCNIIRATLASGEHPVIFDRLDHFSSMNRPHEEGKTVQSSESSHCDDPVELATTSMDAVPAQLHEQLHLSTTSSFDSPDSEANPLRSKKPPRKRKWRKPKDMPKRPLSAYNIFFQTERKKLAREKSADDTERAAASSMGFAGLAQNVAAKWRSLDPSARSYYETEAGKDQIRYRQEVNEWKWRKEERKTDEHETTPPVGTSGMGENVRLSTSNVFPLHQQNDSNSQFSAAQSTPMLSLWPSMPQTIESLGSLYDANVDLLDVSRGNVRQENIVTEGLEPLPINPARDQEARAPSLGATVVSSLHQLCADMEEEELDFLMSLRDLK